MRTPHSTPHTPVVMDVMHPRQAYGAPPTPSALDPRRWLGIVLAILTGVPARVARPGATARVPVVEAGS